MYFLLSPVCLSPFKCLCHCLSDAVFVTFPFDKALGTTGADTVLTSHSSEQSKQCDPLLRPELRNIYEYLDSGEIVIIIAMSHQRTWGCQKREGDDKSTKQIATYSRLPITVCLNMDWLFLYVPGFSVADRCTCRMQVYVR